MTNELLTKVVKKNKLYVVWKTTPLTNENYEIYKARFKDHDKEVKKDILNAKKMYYNRIFDTYRSDMKKTWKTINETLSRNKFIFELPSTFLHDDSELTDPIEIANAFNTRCCGHWSMSTSYCYYFFVNVLSFTTLDRGAT